MISLLNYIIGPTSFTEKELQLVDKAIRRILLRHNINYRAANKDRLCMKIKDFGRGLCSAVHKYELIKLKLSQYLHNNPNFRKTLINETSQSSDPELYAYEIYLARKYNINLGATPLNTKLIIENQQKYLIQNTNKKKIHSKLFENIES